MSTLLDTANRKDSELFSSIEDRIEPQLSTTFTFKTLFWSARTFGQRQILANAELLGADYVTVDEQYSPDRREYIGTATYYKFRTPLSFGDSTHRNTI
jgi:hypothetical protein